MTYIEIAVLQLKTDHGTNGRGTADDEKWMQSVRRVEGED